MAGDSRYEVLASQALRQLQIMRGSLTLLGTALRVLSGECIEYVSIIGPSKNHFTMVIYFV